MKKLLVAVALALILMPFTHAAGSTNVSLMYGWNGTNFVPLLTNADGKLLTDLNMSKSLGITPLTNNTYDLGSTTLLWANLYVRSVRGQGGTLSLYAGSTEALIATTSGLINITKGLNVTAGGLNVISGNVGIGTTAPTTALEVAGNINSTATTGNSSFSGDVRIVGTLYGGSPLKVAGGLNLTSGTIYTATNTADNLSINVNNTLFVNSSSSRVGINTATPTSALDVSGTLTVEGINVTGRQISDNTTLTALLGQKVNITDAGSNNNTIYASLGQKLNLTGGTLSGLLSITGNPSNVGNLSLSVNSTFYINQSTSNVGIGTTVPGYKLEVNGGVAITDAYNAPFMGSSGATGGFQVYSYSTVLRQNYLQLYGNNGAKLSSDVNGNLSIGDGASDVNMYIKNDGNVGIGTTGPGAKLEVKQAGGPGRIKIIGDSTGYTQADVLLQSGTTDSPEDRGLGIYTFNEGNDATWFFGNGYGAGDKFIINRKAGTSFDVSAAAPAESTNLLTIQNNGNVGIGTTGPGAKLDVIGTFRVGGVAGVPFTATGGTITTSGGYTIHTFTTSGTFTPDGAANVEYLVVGGGGGGGGDNGGGGGAGGFQTASGFTVAAQAYSITVGTGGAGGSTNGSDGNNSVFSTITSTGGGGGGKGDPPSGTGNNGVNGSSGGGGGGGFTGGSGGTGTGGQGNNGGNGSSNVGQQGGGGGGGASAVGSNGASNGGAGGAGTASSFSGSSVTYAGGGGGGTGGASGGAGGSGGGGAGSASVTNGNAGTANLGGGGGGGGEGATTGGAGGSGIVIIRYLTSTTANVVESITATAAGNVGIGTTGPASILNIANTGTGQFVISDTDAATNRKNFFIRHSAGMTDFGNLNDALDTFSSYMQINHSTGDTTFAINAGNVGIGTTGPGSRLEVENTASADDVLLLEDSSGLCEAQPTTTGLTWSCSSDIRLKTNVRNASDVLGYIVGIPLRDYTVIKTGENATGPIAQDLLKTNPELVRTGDDGYYQVSELSQWTLVKALQELKGENDNLKEENGAMRSDIEFLKQKVQKLEKTANGGK